MRTGLEPDTGPEPDVGSEPNAVNAGPELDAGPEPDAINAGPEPDAGLEPDVGPEPNAVNAEPEPNAVNAGLEPDVGLEPNAVTVGPKPDVGPEPNAVDRPSGHNSSCRGGRVKAASGLPAKVGTTRLSCGVGGRDGLGFWLARLACCAGWVAGMDSASDHSTSRYGEVKTAGGLPAKVGTTRLSCEDMVVAVQTSDAGNQSKRVEPEPTKYVPSGVAKLYGPECGLSSGLALRAFGSRGLGVYTFPWERVTDARERWSRHLPFYDQKVESG
ncbi:hypothetical protein CRG98_029686 [Punica granatum]|uniref:Uncharacterized protein n=1 Tax=Punica granatum TaxID=22663 RepID=A0A2I0J101_PUNGR|nr:hypothetical protein CRG98_029686 [Punica granatum]